MWAGISTLALALVASQTAARAQDNQVAWYWFGACAAPTATGVEVRLDGRLLHRAAFSLCHMRRGDVTDRQRRAQLRFAFCGGRVFQGEYRTTRADTVEGYIWEAGGDPDAVILGISFSPKRPTPAQSQVLLNTLHIVDPTRARVSVLDAGLTIRTYPIGLRSAARPGARPAPRGAV